jgi:pimeloyl-ACP methyl ester carboxylesterase
MKRQLLLTAFILRIFTVSAQEASINALLTLEHVQYPFNVNYLAFSQTGEELRMAYMDVQPNTPNGKTVLLLHGKNFNGAYWEQTGKKLSSEGYRVIIPDQIGFGKSTKPNNVQYSFHQLAWNTKQLLDTLGVSKVNIVGHSMGGMLACRFTLLYPTMVDKLILENPIGLEDYSVAVPYQPVDQWYQREMKQTYTSLKAYQQKNYYDGKWKPEYERWLTMLSDWTTSLSYPLIALNSARASDMIMTQPVVYEFSRIETRTLLIIGQRDRTAIGKDLMIEDQRLLWGNYPKLGRDTQRKFKNARLVELHNIGHLPHVEAFDRFIKPLSDFLKN